MMELLILLLVGGGCAAFGMYALSKKGAPEALDGDDHRRALPPAAGEERGLDNPLPNDVVSAHGTDWIITGVARLEDGPRAWIECRLEDGNAEGWLVVASDAPETVWLGARTDDLCIVDKPSESIEQNGEVFRLHRHGQAEVECRGHLSHGLASGEGRYWNYRRLGDGRIWIREQNGEWCCYAGESVPRHLLTHLPGS